MSTWPLPAPLKRSWTASLGTPLTMLLPSQLTSTSHSAQSVAIHVHCQKQIFPPNCITTLGHEARRYTSIRRSAQVVRKTPNAIDQGSCYVCSLYSPAHAGWSHLADYDALASCSLTSLSTWLCRWHVQHDLVECAEPGPHLPLPQHLYEHRGALHPT